MELDCMNKRAVKWSDSKLYRKLPPKVYQQNQIDANGSHRPIYKYEIRFPVIARIPHQTKDSLTRRNFLPWAHSKTRLCHLNRLIVLNHISSAVC